MLIGMEIIKIMMLARWSSPVITHYARLAPLKNLADDFKRRIVDRDALGKGASKATTKRRLAREEVDIARVSALLSKQVTTMKEELESLRQALADMKEQHRPPAYAKNLKTKVIHRILTTYDVAGLDAKTICNWKYLKFAGELVRGPPTTKAETCDTCMSALKARLD